MRALYFSNISRNCIKKFKAIFNGLFVVILQNQEIVVLYVSSPYSSSRNIQYSLDWEHIAYIYIYSNHHSRSGIKVLLCAVSIHHKPCSIIILLSMICPFQYLFEAQSQFSASLLHTAPYNNALSLRCGVHNKYASLDLSATAPTGWWRLIPAIHNNKKQKARRLIKRV